MNFREQDRRNIEEFKKWYAWISALPDWNHRVYISVSIGSAPAWEQAVKEGLPAIVYVSSRLLPSCYECFVWRKDSCGA